MIKLYQFSPIPIWNLPNASVFCLKLETYLRMANLPYENVYVNDPRKAPKGKLPFIKNGNRVIADSSLIVTYLKQTYGDVLDANLKPEMHAQSLAIQAMFEDYLYWMIVYSRWADDRFWPQTKEIFFAKLSTPLKWFVPKIIRKKMFEQLKASGMGRHSKEEVYALSKEVIDSIAVLLGEKNYILGNTPHSLDAVAYGFLANIVYPPLETPIKQQVLQHTNLVNYCDRMKAQYYS